MQELSNSIYVNYAIEGIHRYPAAGTEPALEDVSFLQYPHRHIFHHKITISVTHNDRDIEFIQFKRWLQSLYSDKIIEIDYKSCEMLADDLAEQIAAKYPNRVFTIDISEDHENGAVKTYAS